MDGDPHALNGEEAETVDAVIKHYSRFRAHQLSELTHRERPWLRGRNDLVRGERGSVEITHADMAEFYDGLLADES